MPSVPDHAAVSRAGGILRAFRYGDLEHATAIFNADAQPETAGRTVEVLIAFADRAIDGLETQTGESFEDILTRLTNLGYEAVNSTSEDDTGA